MELESAFLMFFSGVIAHAVAIRLFNIWSKALIYKTAYIGCLVVLRMADDTAREIIKAAEPESEKDIDVAFDYWRKITLYSLKNILSDGVWRRICLLDWDVAMKTISELEKKELEIENDV